MKAKLTDLRYRRWVRGDFEINLTSDNPKDDDDIRKLIASLEQGKIELNLRFSTSGGNGCVIYRKCE